MNKQLPRMVSIGVIVALLAVSGLSYAAPGLFQFGESLSQHADGIMTQSFGYSIYYSHSAFYFNLSLADNNPLSTWSPTTSNAYVISVPSGSLFSQTLTPSVTIQGEYDTNQLFGEAYTADTFQITIYANMTFIPYANGVPSGSLVNIGHYIATPTYNTVTSGVGSPITVALQAVSMNLNQSNSYNAMNGIVEESIDVSISSSTANSGLTSAFPPEHQNNVAYAEIYVFPGTGSLNQPNTVQVNNPVTISGTTSYGDYYLLITTPSGSQTTIKLGQTTTLSHKFSQSYTPQELGKYTVSLVNSVVQLTTTQIFSVSVVLPTPTIQVLTPSPSSGYYSTGQTINYHVDMVYSSSLPIQFNLYIYAASSGNQPPQSSSQWISYDIYVKATNSNGLYSYNGTFTIPSAAEQTSAVTILAYATYTASNGSLYASNPVHAQISVGHTTPPVHGSAKGNLLLAIGVLLASLVVAVVNPDTYPMRITTVIVGVVSFLIIYGVGIL